VCSDTDYCETRRADGHQGIGFGADHQVT
jgi:alpha-D-ribose 1-methylphosphonate 5-phosphate C-P lyase